MASLTINPPVPTFALDPLVGKNYTWNWGSRLPAGVTITGATISTDSPLTASAPTIAGSNVTAKLSNPVVGQFLNARCLITMSDGETDIATLQIEGVNA
jgi:hypothetical protein